MQTIVTIENVSLTSRQKKKYEYKVARLSDPNEDPPLSPREALYLILRVSASKIADLKARDELRNRIFTSKTTDLNAWDGLRTRIFASKMADLNLISEP